ncbi:Nucleolin isoform 1 [Schistosoma japonicum]|uniref:Nucleolin isoform 1 n=1 Tax=Schistosoma japonicum TaxID=6182 RepID=Q5D8I0_SCHJA|nr:SJCHGC02473 protein [Schistosoma japonicum]TNN06309.1 Nucleolin isoform 1 [Schistosoma japonicum]
MESTNSPNSLKLSKKSKNHKLKRRLITDNSEIKESVLGDSKKIKQESMPYTSTKKAKREQISSLQSHLSLDATPKQFNHLAPMKAAEQPVSVVSDKDHHSVNNRNCLSMLITDLPNHINYSMLKDAIPSATRLQLIKKYGKRSAFANFSDMNGYSDAVSRLEGIEFDGVKPSFRQVVRRPKPENKKLEDCDLRLTIQNLPFSVTAAELADEFPTAKSIIMNTRKNGTNKGSCLLEFECHSDLQVVLDACQNKEIGGRRVRALVGIHFQLKSESSTLTDNNGKQPHTFSIKIIKLSAVVEDDQLRQQFLPGSIVEYRSVPVGNSSSRNVFITLKNTKPNHLVVTKLRKKGIMEHHLRIFSWHKKNTIPQKVELKPPADSKKNKKRKTDKVDTSLKNNKLIASDSVQRPSQKKKFKTKNKNLIGDNTKHVVFDHDK